MEILGPLLNMGAWISGITVAVYAIVIYLSNRRKGDD